jgi:heme-degrading monooxygenase HmoA
MIARYWSARTTSQNVAPYAEHLETVVFPGLRKLAGFKGATLLRRDLPGGVEVVVMTHWESLAAIRTFAGNDIETAVVTDEAAAMFTEFDRRVRHYEVVL